jgi:hypothetical protein
MSVNRNGERGALADALIGPIDGTRLKRTTALRPKTTVERRNSARIRQPATPGRKAKVGNPDSAVD